MKKHRIFLNLANFLVSSITLLSLTIAGLYAGYGLWDNRSIVNSADEIRNDMIKLKPQIVEEDETISFGEIREINPDVVGWVTMKDTAIDYPVVQGENNLSYINTDVYGDFALAGSIFLDSFGNSEFEDPYNLLYGHSISLGRMFSDINKFKNENFYKNHSSGELITPKEIYNLEVFALLVIPSNEREIFEPLYWEESMEEFTDYIRETAKFFNEDALDRLERDPAIRVLALTTCSDEFTDARTGVLTLMHPGKIQIGGSHDK